MHLPPRHLKIFVALAQSLNFTRTAEQLYVSQPRLSKIIREIEECVGVQLFDRSTRRVALTSDGAALLPIAKRMIENYEIGLAELQEAADRKRQRLIMAVLPTLAGTFMPAVLASAQAAHPTMSFKLYDVPAGACIELLRARKVEIALTSIEDAQPDLQFKEILQDPFVMLSARSMALPWKTVPAWSEAAFNTLPLICTPRGTGFRRAIDASFIRENTQLRPVLEVDHLAGLAKFVKAEFGFALLPLLAAELVLDADLVITQFSHAPTRCLGVVARQGEERSFMAEFVVDAMVRFSKKRNTEVNGLSTFTPGVKPG